ncbi:hypothetical protein EJ110_NYTH31571 [Nymphaea thermarum]|nr:hypothetical protein EJ110_NYTH31571 [Nymphaea thermarum]
MATQWNAIPALVSVKLNRDNYLLWSSQLESVMESQELIQFIDETSPAPSETIVKDGKSEVNPEFAVWKRSDRLALSLIKATVSEPVLRQIVTSKSAFEAWNTLKKSFSSQSPLRIMLLRKELHFIQKGNMDMQTYLERIKFLADTLSAAGLDTTDGDLVQITMNDGSECSANFTEELVSRWLLNMTDGSPSSPVDPLCDPTQSTPASTYTVLLLPMATTSATTSPHEHLGLSLNETESPTSETPSVLDTPTTSDLAIVAATTSLDPPTRSHQMLTRSMTVIVCH